MPDVARGEIGRRVFQLKKEKSVEEALAIIRNSIAQEWRSLTEEDIHYMRRMLGDLWVYIDRTTWEQYSFSRLTCHEIGIIIQTGRSVSEGRIQEKAAIEEISKLLSSHK